MYNYEIDICYNTFTEYQTAFLKVFGLDDWDNDVISSGRTKLYFSLKKEPYFEELFSYACKNNLLQENREDTEWGFRVWNRGHWIVPVWSAIGIHQEPEGGRNETDREAGSAVTKPMLSERVPLNYREEEPGRVWHTPMVSIYMPAYNAEKTIVSAVQSALNQTFTDIEICIVDDGSTDGTRELLRERLNAKICVN